MEIAVTIVELDASQHNVNVIQDIEPSWNAGHWCPGEVYAKANDDSNDINPSKSLL